MPLKINQWSKEDRPREKFEELGPRQLSSAELLAILIGSGCPGKDAVVLMKEILNDHDNSLRRLGRVDIQSLCRYAGIGPAKAITILAACELGRRRAEEPAEQRPLMDGPQKIYSFFRQRLEDTPHEEFHAMFLNRRLQLVSEALIGRGGLTETTVDVRLLFGKALEAKATALAICHNHPSGNPRPSHADDRLTQKVAQAARLLDIRLVDHIIVADKCYYSYQEEGKLD